MTETKTKDRPMLKKAFGMGFISIFAYLASYYTRSLLSVATPNMLGNTDLTEEFIGLLASVQFIVYAAGQLVNGAAGDIINPKYMISVGLAITGSACILFPIVPYAWLQVLCFAIMGVGLSMLRGPIMKMVSENLNKDYSRIVCTLLSAASFLGSLVASGFAIAFNWDKMFIIAGSITLGVAVIAFIVLSIFEAKGLFVFQNHKKSVLGGFADLFKIENIAFYLVVSGVVEISGSAIGFWIPTYLSDALGYSVVKTNVINSVMSVFSSLAPFIALFVFKLIKEKDILMLRCGFSMAVVAFVAMIFVPWGYGKLVLLIFAKLCLSCCSSVLWSIYIPGMGNTGKVSSLNGIINCTGYVSAAVANLIFSKMLGISWNGVIIMWCGIAAIGLVASLIVRSRKKQPA